MYYYICYECYWRLCFFIWKMTRKIKPKDWDNASLYYGERRAKKILKYLPKKGKHLDVGTGEGNGTIVFSNIKTTYGIDFGFKSTLAAKKKGIIMVNASGTHIPFKNNTFDSISCLDVLEHIPDYESVFKEFSRILKPNGILILQTPISSYFKERVLRFVRKHNIVKMKQPYDKPLPRVVLLEQIKKNNLIILKEKPIRYYEPNPIVYYFSWSRLFLCSK